MLHSLRLRFESWRSLACLPQWVHDYDTKCKKLYGPESKVRSFTVGPRCQMLLKLILLTAVFTLLLLLMDSAGHSKQLQSELTQETLNDPGFTTSAVPSANPVTARPRPLVNGMPCRELPERFPDSIPPIVHWTTKDGRVHKLLVYTVKTWLLMHNRNITNSTMKWYFMHWDDIQIKQLVDKHYPVLSKIYPKLANGLERSDIGRLVVLHHVGGVYVDLDVEIRRDLTPLLIPEDQQPNNEEVSTGSRKSASCRSALWSQEPPEHAEFIFNRRWMISNAVMMSRARHSFLDYVLSSWPAWFEANWAKKSRTHNQAVFVTGPMMLQTFYDKYAAQNKSERPSDWCDNMVAEPEQFQPIMDNNFIRYHFIPGCKNIEKLSEPQQVLCRDALCANFKNREVPSRAYTLHHFMHLSYTNNMNMGDSQCIMRLLPILKCKI